MAGMSYSERVDCLKLSSVYPSRGSLCERWAVAWKIASAVSGLVWKISVFCGLGSSTRVHMKV